MRLLKTDTLKFQEFFEPPSEGYAILSHRWGTLDDEVSYKEYLKGTKTNRPGYKKIIKFCELARKDGYNWAWCDTACIDKRSSAELTEAINSMYEWYRKSEKCYVYLSDVEDSNWDSSEWWRRGWTLQELIAPKRITFYDRKWSIVGDKKDEGMAEKIALAAKLPRNLIVKGDLSDYGGAERLSWASHRTTTRVEDEAYCLLGLLQVNMPMLYGEGTSAFRRLQRLVFERTGDESVLAFACDWKEDRTWKWSLFATSPKQFAGNATAGGHVAMWYPWRNQPPRFTVWGLEIISDAIRFQFHYADGVKANYYIVKLACGLFDEIEPKRPPSRQCFLALLPLTERRPGVYECLRMPLPEITGNPLDSIKRIDDVRRRTRLKVDVTQVKESTFIIVINE